MYNIVQMGCGGTGGHLISFLAPYFHTHRSSIKTYTIVDGDIVEQRNTLRQNFTNDDVSYNKAEVFAKKYQLDYKTQFVTPENIEFLNLFDVNCTTILLGCVDSVKTRLFIDEYLKSNKYDVVYIDGGNTENNAQVIIYDYIKKKGQDVTEYFKDSLNEDVKAASCSELGDQSIKANLLSATHIFTNVVQYIEKGKFEVYKILITPHTMVSV